MTHRFAKENTHSLYQFSDQSIEDALEFWQPRCAHRKPLYEDAREIISNVAGFIQVLREWDEKERAKEKPVPEMP